MKSKYTSSKSVAKNQTVPINVDDPRLAWNKIGQTKARQGAEIDIIGLDGKSLILGGTGLNNPTGSTSTTDKNKDQTTILIPPLDNQPPKVYPGGSGSFVITPTDPTDVSASWSGDDLVISFNWDPTNEYNVTMSQFIVALTSDGVTKRTPLNTFSINKTQTAQSVTVTKSMITTMFNIFRTSFSSICVLVADPLANISNTICASSVPSYVLDLPTPVITVTAVNNGYSVAYTTPTQSAYDAIEIVEYESTSSTEPTGVTYVRTYFNTINPAVVTVSNFNKRWVKARFSSDGGVYTPYCAAQAVTPTSPVSVDLTPPNEVSSVSAAWSGDDIIVSYSLPSTDPAVRVQIELVAPNLSVGYFYRFPAGSGTSQTATITKKDLLDQFGEHYSSFTGLLKSIDSSDNRSSGVSFNVPVRTNPLSGVVPTFNVTPLTNGYSVFATNYATTPGVSYMEVYAKHTAWSGNPTDDTYVVYSGANPAVIIDTDYTTVYIKIHYYDDFGNTSSYSIEKTTTPLNSGEVTSFENPITFGVNGVIYAGTNYDSGNRTIFKTSGLFAYDATNTSPSTQIVSNASAGTPTFITTQAQIADWNITSTKIENTLSGTPSKYTGLSATGTYSFWAGSSVSGGNSSAKFTVTPLGAVTARELYIIGTGDANSKLIDAGGSFYVKHDGSLYATAATITGNITASSGTFSGNVSIGAAGSLYSGTIAGGSLSGLGYILNQNGILFQNAGGSAITQITASNGQLITTSANIGGWTVNSSQIAKTSLTGGGNIVLDSTSGYISVSNTNVAGYTAGINATTTAMTSNAFWAGTGGATSTSNGFRVTLGGQLYATGASITGGTVSSSGSLGSIVLDGDKSLISLSTSSKTSYLIPRNGNIYLTAPGTSLPWGTSDGSGGTNTTAPTGEPYFVAGSNFKDPWSNTTSGIGMYTGSWDYFTSGTSDPFITVAKSGTIQLSASPDIGLIVEKGGATGDAFTVPTIMLYTSKNASTYKPTTAYGAWATFQKGYINMSASSTAYISIFGDTQSGTSWPVGAVANSIFIKSGGTRTSSDSGAYAGSSQIIANPTSLQITGLPVQGALDMQDYRSGRNVIINGVSVAANNAYKNTSPLGYLPRQRMVVEDPVTGIAQLGLGIYYLDLNKANTTTPSSDTGVLGDIVLVF